MSLIPDIATGPYLATYNASGAVAGTPGQNADPAARSLGMVDNVHRFTRAAAAEDVGNTNLYGSTVIDGIYRGGQMFVMLTIKEWPAYIRDILWPFATNFGDVGQVGRMLSSMAGAIVLTPVEGTPAYVKDPIIRTFGKAIISPEHNVDIPLGPTARDVPLVFRCFPYNVTTGEGESAVTRQVWFTEAPVAGD